MATGQPLVFAPGPSFPSTAFPPPADPSAGAEAPLYDPSGRRAVLTTTIPRPPPRTGARAGRRPVAPRPAAAATAAKPMLTAEQVDARSLAETPADLDIPITDIASLFAFNNAESLSMTRYVPGWPLASFSDLLGVRKNDLRDLVNVLRWQLGSDMSQPAGGSPALSCLVDALDKVSEVVEGFVGYAGQKTWDDYHHGGVRSWARAVRYAKAQLVDVHGVAMAQQMPAEGLDRLSDALIKAEDYFGGKFE